MSISRFQLRRRTLNANKMYKDIFHERGVKYIKHYRTGKLEYPSQKQLQKLETVQHLWKLGDRYEKLAYKYYGDSRLWWVIAWINLRPAEFSNSAGDVLYIPTSLENTLSMLNI